MKLILLLQIAKSLSWCSYLLRRWLLNTLHALSIQSKCIHGFNKQLSNDSCPAGNFAHHRPLDYLELGLSVLVLGDASDNARVTLCGVGDHQSVAAGLIHHDLVRGVVDDGKAVDVPKHLVGIGRGGS